MGILYKFPTYAFIHWSNANIYTLNQKQYRKNKTFESYEFNNMVLYWTKRMTLLVLSKYPIFPLPFDLRWFLKEKKLINFKY
jgi:hypothetical protein